jgi:hypothetical protein
MASDRKIAANRRNSRRSSGPRTVAGKLTVSRNALRHGLAAATLRDAGIAAEVDRLATAIGGEHADAAQREQALIIAESERESRSDTTARNLMQRRHGFRRCRV